MINKIKACPFCNCGNVKLHKNFDYVYCENCGARGSYFDGHPKDAIDAWNRVANKSGFSFMIPEERIVSEIKKTNLDGTKGMTRG